MKKLFTLIVTREKGQEEFRRNHHAGPEIRTSQASEAAAQAAFYFPEGK